MNIPICSECQVSMKSSYTIKPWYDAFFPERAQTLEWIEAWKCPQCGQVENKLNPADLILTNQI
jgi:hypothetical protein